MTVHARTQPPRTLKSAKAATGPRTLRDARAHKALTGGPTAPVKVAGGKARTLTRALYAAHLDTATSKAGDLFSSRTVEGYMEAVDALNAHLITVGFTGDFTDADADVLSAFLAAYRKTHTQGGTNTKMRRLRPFYAWLEATYDVPSPFRSGRVSYYAPSEPPAATLDADVIADLLAVCSGKAYEDVRDTAMLKLARRGIRRKELLNLYVEDFDFTDQSVMVGALKGARAKATRVRMVDGEEHRAGRRIVLGADTLVAVHKWLQVRGAHKLVADPESGPMWYGTRGRGKMTGNGILRMVKRRAEEAGYDPGTINVHAFRHTRAHEALSAGLPESVVMEDMGWRDRSMVDRYARDMRNRRAGDAVRAAGLA